MSTVGNIPVSPAPDGRKHCATHWPGFEHTCDDCMLPSNQLEPDSVSPSGRTYDRAEEYEAAQERQRPDPKAPSGLDGMIRDIL